MSPRQSHRAATPRRVGRQAAQYPRQLEPFPHAFRDKTDPLAGMQLARHPAMPRLPPHPVPPTPSTPRHHACNASTPPPDPRPNPGPGARAQSLISHHHLLRRRRGALGLFGHAGNDTECSRCCAGDTAVASCLGARRRPGAICTRQAVHPTSRARACARVRAIGADRRQALAWVGLALRPRT